MNKYLKGLINLSLKLCIAYVGFTFSMGVLAAGFLAFPSIVMRVDQALADITVIKIIFFGGSIVIFEIIRHVIGLIPLYCLLAFLAGFLFFMFLTIRIINRTDIELILKRFFPGQTVKESIKAPGHGSQGF